MKCPECNSTDIVFFTGSDKNTEEMWMCHKCGAVWPVAVDPRKFEMKKNDAA